MLRLLQPDLLTALLITGIAVFVFFAVRVGVLPKKNIPLVVGVLLAAVGIGVWRQRRASELHKILKEKEAELRRREAELKRLKDEFELSDEEATAAVARRNAEVETITNEILELRKHHAEEAARINAMTPDERRDHVLNMKFPLTILFLLMTAASASAQLPSAVVLSREANGYKVKIGVDTMVALNDRAVRAIAQMQNDLERLRGENVRQQRIIAAFERTDSVLEKAREDARTYVSALEVQMKGYKELAEGYKRLNAPRTLSLEGGIGVSGSETKPAFVVGLGISRLRVFGLLQENNVGGFVGANLPIF